MSTESPDTHLGHADADRGDANYRTLFDALPVPVVIAHASDGTILYANAAELEYAEAASMDEVLGRMIFEFIDPGDLEKAGRNTAAVFKGEPITGDARYNTFTLTGAPRQTDIYSIPTRFEGQEAIFSILVDATGQTEERRARESAEASYRAMVETSPDGVIVHVDGHLVYLNPAALRMFGFARLEDAIGLHHTELVAPDSVESTVERVRNLLAGGRASEALTRVLLRQDGSTFLGEATAIALDFEGRPAVQVLIRDVSEQDANRRALADAEARYRAIVELMPDALVIAIEGRVAYLNERTLDLLGYERAEDMLGRPYEDFISADDRVPAAGRVDEALTKGGPLPPALRTVVRSDGSTFPAEVVAVRVEFDGRPGVQVLLRDVTDRLAQLGALREAEERYRALVEMSPDAILVHTGGTIVYLNPTGLRLVGASSPDEVIGRSVMDFVDPVSAASVAGRLTAMAEGQVFVEPLIEALRMLDGRPILAEVSARPLEFSGVPSILVIARDVSEREAERTARRDAESRANAIVDSIPIGMHFYRLEDDDTLRFEGANAAADAILGVDHSGLVGLPIEQAFPMHASTDMPDVYRAVVRTGELYHNEDVYYADGRIDSSFDVHAFRTGPSEMVATFVDITDRARAEAELAAYRGHLEGLVEDRTHELTEANRELLEATRAKSAFLASMSHELRTPLNSIIGFSGVLAQGIAGPLNEEQERQLQMINRSGRQLLSLVGDVLDLAKIEAGRVDLAMDEFEVTRFVRTIADTVRPMAAERNLELHVYLSQAPERMVGDREKIEQVLLNLLSNAIKYTDEGYVSITVATRPDGSVSFVVRDSGIGIAREDHDRVFEEFRQVTPAGTAKNPGTGLGLSIARHLAALMGGVIELKSEPGVGSAFSLVIPNG
ncbi:MAG: PAS domain S-box protein [Coriobacteriia bacterium]|nr:PAS domain S-box protein [Coriobacteriia bacterium]